MGGNTAHQTWAKALIGRFKPEDLASSMKRLAEGQPVEQLADDRKLLG